MQQTSVSTNGAADSALLPVGAAEMNQATAASPAVWLAGDPEDLKPWMSRGAAGIVTNTVVLNEMVQKYGQMTDVIQRYLDITDKKVAVEIDGHSTQELLDVGEVFTKMSDRVILKIPCSVNALGAFAELKKAGVETFCTTVFTLNQAVAVAQAGVTHVLPFCEPYRDVSGDPTALVRDLRDVFADWAQRPYITAALVRSKDTAEAASARRLPMASSCSGPSSRRCCKRNSQTNGTQHSSTSGTRCTTQGCWRACHTSGTSALQIVFSI